MRRFVDVHSHVVPSGDDGARSLEAGLALCFDAAERGTAVLYATPHVWPSLPLTERRERQVRATHAEMAPLAEARGLDLRLGWELTPDERLLRQNLERFRLGDLPAVLLEIPFVGPLAGAVALAAAVESFGLTPVIAHPERAESILADPPAAEVLRERGWLLQVNATSLLGRHGQEQEETGWALVEDGLADLVASDGHRTARPPVLDEAYRVVRQRVGERADALFDGSAFDALAHPDGLDLAQRG